MSDVDDALLTATETHDASALRALLDGGLAANANVRGKTPVQWLLEMYLRSERFAPCLRLLLERGGALPDPALAPVLLDDADGLRGAIARDPSLLTRRFDLVSAFTPLLGATALHVAAEYGHVAAANVLIAAGADVEARAATTSDGGDGHTPLFHTVSSILDHGAPVMRVLLAAGARTDVRLPSLTWGRGFEWQTTLFDVTPISYCQAGLLPQFHRREGDVYRNLDALLASVGRKGAPFANVPNRYLQPRGGARS
jgi:ankyrin repeat protein